MYCDHAVTHQAIIPAPLSLKYSMCIRKAILWLCISDIKDLGPNVAAHVTGLPQ